MTERLIIRLASKASQKNHWLIWSDNENEIIASGEVDNAEQLNLLTEKAQHRVVICLLPNVDISIRAISVNGSLTRQIKHALPYLIEEELASDVDTLHFSIIAKQNDLLHVAICEKQKIVKWLKWLETAHIRCRQFIPEGLTLPVADDGKWRAVQLGTQWVIRENYNNAWSCEQDMLDLILASKFEDDGGSPQIESYSPSAENRVGDWIELSPVLPMEIFAKGTQNNKINLLTGEFKPKKERNKQLEKWRVPAILLSTLFIVMMLNLYLKNLQVEKETRLVKQYVEDVYKQAFPLQNALRYPGIKKKLNAMLVDLEGHYESGFLKMLNELVPAFANNPRLQPSSLKFDGNKQEMRILVRADNFQSFEKFNAAVPKHFSVEQGALSSNKDGVSGLLTIRMK